MLLYHLSICKKELINNATENGKANLVFVYFSEFRKSNDQIFLQINKTDFKRLLIFIDATMAIARTSVKLSGKNRRLCC